MCALSVGEISPVLVNDVAESQILAVCVVIFL